MKSAGYEMLAGFVQQPVLAWICELAVVRRLQGDTASVAVVALPVAVVAPALAVVTLAAAMISSATTVMPLAMAAVVLAVAVGTVAMAVVTAAMAVVGPAVAGPGLVPGVPLALAETQVGVAPQQPL